MKNIPSIIYTNEDYYGYTNKTFEYLLGFQPSLGYMIITEVKIYIILDSRYFDKLKNIDSEDLYDKIGKKTKLIFILLDKNIEKIIKENITGRKIKLENSSSVSFYKKLENFGFEITTISHIFEINRLLKDISEIKSIKKAINIIEKVWKDIEKLNKSGEIIGKTELEIRQFIIEKIFKYGGTGESFPSIVASGTNSSIPHYETSKTKIKTGPLLVDMGAIYNGYCSDFTRTLWVNPSPITPLSKKEENKKEKFIKIQSIVKKAHNEAKKAINPGIKCSFLDFLARNYIKDAGYGEYFTHSTGHGVGLNIHESPYISSKSDDIVKTGMVFTIEPGIYLPGEFGIRYENIFIVE